MDKIYIKYWAIQNNNGFSFGESAVYNKFGGQVLISFLYWKYLFYFVKQRCNER